MVGGVLVIGDWCIGVLVYWCIGKWCIGLPAEALAKEGERLYYRISTMMQRFKKII